MTNDYERRKKLILCASKRRVFSVCRLKFTNVMYGNDCCLQRSFPIDDILNSSPEIYIRDQVATRDVVRNRVEILTFLGRTMPL